MWQWSDKLKLGRAFVKRDLRVLPLTDAEFEADFFLDPVFSTKHQLRTATRIANQLSDALGIASPVLRP